MILDFIKDFCKLIKVPVSLIYILEIAFYISIYNNNKEIVPFIISELFNSHEILSFFDLWLSNIIMIIFVVQLLLNCAFIILDKHILKVYTDRWFVINTYFISIKMFTYILKNYQKRFVEFFGNILITLVTCIIIYLISLIISLYCKKLFQTKLK